MAKIIDFKEACRKRDAFENFDFDRLFKHSSRIFREGRESFHDKFGVIGAKRIRNYFEGEVTKEIFTRNLLGRGTLLCGIYVSNLLAELITNSPESWWAIDYATSEDPLAIKRGGDVCFIICGVFPERGNCRLMKISYYQKIGSSLYFKFYGLSNKEIGYHMSQQFEIMVEVVQNCLRSIKDDAGRNTIL